MNIFCYLFCAFLFIGIKYCTVSSSEGASASTGSELEQAQIRNKEPQRYELDFQLSLQQPVTIN